MIVARGTIRSVLESNCPRFHCDHPVTPCAGLAEATKTYWEGADDSRAARTLSREIRPTALYGGRSKRVAKLRAERRRSLRREPESRELGLCRVSRGNGGRIQSPSLQVAPTHEDTREQCFVCFVCGTVVSTNSFGGSWIFDVEDQIL